MKVKGRQTLGSYLLVHMLLSVGLPSRQNLTQQSKKNLPVSVDGWRQAMSSFHKLERLHEGYLVHRQCAFVDRFVLSYELFI